MRGLRARLVRTMRGALLLRALLCCPTLVDARARGSVALSGLNSLARNTLAIPEEYARANGISAVPSEQTLPQLALYYGTDKATVTSKLGVAYGFASVYDVVFSPLRDRVRSLLELGVFFGSSLKM